MSSLAGDSVTRGPWRDSWDSHSQNDREELAAGPPIPPSSWEPFIRAGEEVALPISAQSQPRYPWGLECQQGSFLSPGPGKWVSSQDRVCRPLALGSSARRDPRAATQCRIETNHTWAQGLCKTGTVAVQSLKQEKVIWSYTPTATKPWGP